MSPHKVVTLCNHSSLKYAECASKARHEDSVATLALQGLWYHASYKLKRHGNEHTTPYKI